MLFFIGWIALFAVPRWWALVILALALAAFKAYVRLDIMRQMTAQGIVVDNAFITQTITGAIVAAIVFAIVGAGIVLLRRMLKPATV